MRDIGGLLGKNIFEPLYEHLNKVVECLEMLPTMVHAYLAGSGEDFAKSAKNIHIKEGEADIIKNEIRNNLSHSLFATTERNEVLIFLNIEDQISDNCEEVAKLLEIRLTTIPQLIQDDLLYLVAMQKEAVDMLLEIITGLKGHSPRKFPRNELAKINHQVRAIHKKEFESDTLELAIFKKIFSIENELDPITIVFLMNIIKHIGHISDSAENAVDSLLRILSPK